MASTSKHSISVAGIVINDDDRVLVIRRDDNGRWEAPGGVLELGESFEAGVRREVLEETGLTISVERLTGVYKNLTHGIVGQQLSKCYSAVSRSISCNVDLNGECAVTSNRV
jgi:8-oxo-dGTP diphosphatase